jgi:ABC-type lipoprotein export system ATPase subunit
MKLTPEQKEANKIARQEARKEAKRVAKIEAERNQKPVQLNGKSQGRGAIAPA